MALHQQWWGGQRRPSLSTSINATQPEREAKLTPRLRLTPNVTFKHELKHLHQVHNAVNAQLKP